MSDRCKRRRPLFLGAIVVQLAGVSFLIAAPSLGYYIAGIVVAGCSSGFVWTSSLALVLESATERHLASAMGYVGLSISCGVLIGPILGGIVYREKGHFAVWATCFGLIGIDLILRLMMIEPRASALPEDRGDMRSQDMAAIETQTSVSNASLASEIGTPLSSGSSRRDDPLNWRPSIFELLMSRRFSFAVVATIFLATITTSFDGCLPVYTDELFGFTSIDTGLLYIALAVPAFLQPAIGHLVDRYGGRFIGAGGFLISVPAFVCLRFVDANSTKSLVILIVLLAIIGTFMSATIPVYMAEVSCVVLDKRANDSNAPDDVSNFAQAYSLWSGAYTIGCTIGPLFGGWVQERAGWKTETWAIGLVCAVSGAFALLLTGPSRSRCQNS